jgi:hypothetical protein
MHAVSAINRYITPRSDYIRLNRISHTDKFTVTYSYETGGRVKPYFNSDLEFFVRYNFDISDVPDSILAIPFVANTLPIAWVLDADLHVPELDRDFAKHISDMKRGYQVVHQGTTFAGSIKIGKKINNRYPPSGKVAQSFSGGADSFNTLISHIDQKPILVTLIGADVPLDDETGIRNLIDIVDTTVKQFSLSNVVVETNFRDFVDYGWLTDLVMPTSKDNWWHGFQHGIGIIGHVSPIAYHYKLDTFYFASTFTQKEFEARISCASYPIIDEAVHIAGMNTIHDGFEFTRQQKIHNICQFANKIGHDVPLHVCWQSTGGQNCNHCEKCLRTIVAIIVEGDNPDKFNFHYTKDSGEQIKLVLQNEVIHAKDRVLLALWKDIQSRAIENKEYIIRNYPELKWIYGLKI